MRNDYPITLHSINHTRREKKTCPEAFVYSFWGMDLFLFISFILFFFRVITLFYGYTFLTNSIWIKLVYKHSKWLVIVIGCTHLVGDFRVNRVQGLVGSTSGCVLSGTPRSIQPRNKSITYMNSNSKKKENQVIYFGSTLGSLERLELLSRFISSGCLLLLLLAQSSSVSAASYLPWRR